MPPAAPPELTIVLPTFNERANVRPTVARIAEALDGVVWEAVFVDDDSPDGTAEEVRALAAQDGRVRLIHRIGRRGLAGACIEGMLSSAAPFCAVMDADLQHDAAALPAMLARLRGDPALDLAVGSRTAPGGSAGAGFAPGRAAVSRLATGIARRLLRIGVSDPMSGYFMLRRDRFGPVAPRLQHSGFKILADLLSVTRGDWRVAEVPYTFRPRLSGESKLDMAVSLEFLGLVLSRLTGGLVSIRFMLFALVGLSGVFVQLAVVRLMLALAPGPFVLAQVIGVIAAMTTNFLFNNLLTYRDRMLRGREFLRGLLSFYAVCALGAVANVAVAGLLDAAALPWWAASLAGAVTGAIWNFVASARLTWRAQ